MAVNYWAVLLCGVAAMVVGTLWYGPLFGKQWMAMTGMTEAEVEAAKKDPSSMYRSYGVMFVGALVMAFVLSRGIAFGNAYLGSATTATALISAFWFWAGFVAPVMLSPVLWEKKPWTFWALTSGYYLVSMLVMAVILSIWP